MSTHQYTIASFGGEDIVAGHISKLIAEDAVGFPTTWVINVDIPSCVDKVEAVFSTSLSAGEITALGVLMAAYVAPTAAQIMTREDPSLAGFELSWTAIDEVAIAAGKCIDSDGAVDMILDAATSIDKDVSGVGGIDTGTLAASTSYVIWLISDAANQHPIAVIFSLSTTAPTMPSGYDLKRRIGSFSTDSSSEVMDFRQWGSLSHRRYQWEEDRNPGLRCLDAGTSATWASWTLGHTVSAMVETVLLTCQTSTSLGYIRREGSDITSGEQLVEGGAFSSYRVGVVDNKVEYKITSGNMSADTVGYTEGL